MPRKRWIKLWTQETLYGTTITELEAAERWVWLGFLALAGDSIQPGKIQAAPGIPWTDSQLAQLLGVSIDVLQSAKAKMLQHGKININSDVIIISNWERYQSEYDRTKKYRATPLSTTKATPKQNVEENVEELQQKVSPITDQRGGEGEEPHPTTPPLPFTKVKGLEDLMNKATKLSNKKEKISLCIDAFKFYHSDAPSDDLENSGPRIAGILKSISYDYGYLLKLIWESRAIDISGSHLNYIQGMIKGKDGVRLEDSGMYKEL